MTRFDDMIERRRTEQLRTDKNRYSPETRAERRTAQAVNRQRDVDQANIQKEQKARYRQFPGASPLHLFGYEGGQICDEFLDTMRIRDFPKISGLFSMESGDTDTSILSIFKKNYGAPGPVKQGYNIGRIASLSSPLSYASNSPVFLCTDGLVRAVIIQNRDAGMNRGNWWVQQAVVSPPTGFYTGLDNEYQTRISVAGYNGMDGESVETRVGFKPLPLEETLSQIALRACV